MIRCSNLKITHNFEKYNLHTALVLILSISINNANMQQKFCELLYCKLGKLNSCLFMVVFYLEVEHRSGHHSSSTLFQTRTPISLPLFSWSGLFHPG